MDRDSHQISGARQDDADLPPPPTKRQIIGSILICLHVVAITIAPASVPPASTSTQTVWRVFRPYLEGAYLNHGYHFFAPDPGSSSIVEYTTIDRDGNREWHRMPDKQSMRPRLLYHRYFMLTEFYGGLPPAAADLKHAVIQSYAHRIMANSDSVAVEIAHVEHQLSSQEEVLHGGDLLDPIKYEAVPLGTFQLANLASPPVELPHADFVSDAPPQANVPTDSKDTEH